MMHQAVARKLVVQADGKLSPRELAHEVTVLVEGLADRLNVHGVVPGHIKALVEENGFYAMFNCTRRGEVRVELSPGWDSADLRRPNLRLNIVVFGFPEGRAETAVDEVLRSSPLRLSG